MFKNFLLLSLRNLASNRLFSAINILGLAVGLACVILISLFVSHELSYDKHWANADRTYKVMRTFLPSNGRESLNLATNAPQTGPLIAQDFPEFESVVRMMGAGQLVVTHPETNRPFNEDGLLFVDSNVYEVFDIPLIEGDWPTALQAPFQIVITETLANRYFEDGDAMGKTLLVANQAPMEVTGIMEDIGENTHIAAEAFMSVSTTVAMFGESFLDNWGSNNFHTYFVAPEGYNIDRFIEEIPDFMNRHIAENATSFTNFEVLPISDIHLHSQRDNELEANGNINTVYTFLAIALFILLIACFNFMNLSTARSASRAREVGLRKTLGADRQQIMLQFLGESCALTLIATAFAVGLVEVLLPWFNSVLGMNLSIQYFENPLIVLALAILAILVGVSAGSYPAFYLSSFPSSNVLKGELTRGKSGVSLRKVLVVVQFSISIALVVASGIAVSQLQYANNMDTGFSKEQILIYQGTGLEGLGSDYPTMKQELLRHPEIISVTAANLMPGDQNTNTNGIRYEGMPQDGGFVGMPYLNVDYDFFETFGIEVLHGRSFSEDFGTDLFIIPTDETPQTTGNFILNARAARQIGMTEESAINQWFEEGFGGGRTVRGSIVGVVSDINFSSIREEVAPLYYRVMENDNPQQRFPNFGQMAVRVSGSNLTETLEFIEQTWIQFLPDVPFQQEFMDQRMQDLYQAEQQQSRLFTSFSIMAILIASMGLFGLASYLTEQRTKEIGVRKVLGGSVMDIVALLTKDFSKLVLMANLIAWPAAWYLMNAWLEGFAYRTPINISIFFFAGFLAWALASITVGGLAAITANINPTLSLRHE